MKLTALKELLTQRYQTIDDLNQKFQQSYDEKQVDNSNSRFKEELDFAVSLNERYCRAVVFVLRVFSGQDTVEGFTPQLNLEYWGPICHYSLSRILKAVSGFGICTSSPLVLLEWSLTRRLLSASLLN